MNQYVMKIREKFIQPVKDGIKKREYRLNDETRKKIVPGDVLVLVSTQNDDEYVRVRVDSRECFPNWEMALRKYWEEDFKGLYSSLNEALADCYRFYSKQEVDRYGIVVFSIQEEKRDLKNSFVLLDTNIILQRESHNNVSYEVAEMYKWFDSLPCHKMVHPATRTEIAGYKDATIRDNMLVKLDSYEMVDPNETSSPDFDSIINKYPKNENSLIDNKLLFQLYKGVVDYLITNDGEMLRKAQDLYVREFVLTAVEFLHRSETDYPRLVSYKMLQVKNVLFGDVNFDDHFFDSLKDDYGPGFITWFANKRKANEHAYVFMNGKDLQGFLYLKFEDESEPYGDIAPSFSPMKRMKIGTFKIVSTGLRVGERFLKYVFDNAISHHVKEIYVTLFENRQEVVALRDLLEKWGFVKWGTKNGSESVFVKKMGAYCNDHDPKFNFPNLCQNHRYFFLPIFAQYHTDLFPDSILTGENVTLYNENKAHRYAIEKVYVTNRKNVPMNPGDVVLIYRNGDRYPKRYSSVVTGIAVFQEALFPKTLDEYLADCKNITVFSKQELIDFYNQSTYRAIIKLLFLSSFNKKVLLNDLYDLCIVSENNGPRPFELLTEEQFRCIINCSNGGKLK